METVTARTSSRKGRVDYNTVCPPGFVKYPPEKSTDPINNPKFAGILEKKKKYQEELETHEAIAGVAEFEKKMSGKSKKIENEIPKYPLNNQEKMLVNQYVATEEDEFFDLPTLRATNKASKITFLMKPSAWNAVDEPLCLSKRVCYTSTGNRFMKPRPFVVPKSSLTSNKCIPLVKKDLIANHKGKLNKYTAQLLLSRTCDNHVKEETLRKKYEAQKQFNLKLSEDRLVKCANLGQKWAVKKLVGPPPPPPSSSVPSEIDLEAIRELNLKDQEMIREEKERKCQISTYGISESITPSSTSII